MKPDGVLRSGRRRYKRLLLNVVGNPGGLTLADLIYTRHTHPDPTLYPAPLLPSVVRALQCYWALGDTRTDMRGSLESSHHCTRGGPRGGNLENTAPDLRCL